MKEELAKALFDVAEFAFEHGEILKAYQLIEARPAIIQDDEKLNELFDRVRGRMTEIANFQNYFRHDSGFVEPPDVSKKPCYMKLRKKLEELGNVSYLVDVGCFSGWVGRNLSIWGYKVHGIDLDNRTLEEARFLATGTRATYERLEGSKLGEAYPETFDGAIMFDILEHVFDDKLFLSSVERSVKPGGWVFMNLPYYDKERQIAQGNTPDIVKEHMRAYTDLDLNKLLEHRKNLNVEIVYEEGLPSYFITYQI